MKFILGFCAALLLVGCAGFTYKFYGIADVSYDQGKLLGPKPADDLPFSRCAPTPPQSKHNCVIMFVTDFFAFKQDYEDTKLKLSECEGRK